MNNQTNNNNNNNNNNKRVIITIIVIIPGVENSAGATGDGSRREPQLPLQHEAWPERGGVLNQIVLKCSRLWHNIVDYRIIWYKEI